MDWYYPVLSGAIADTDARQHLAERHGEFVIDGLGVRCVSDKTWVTTAETCECAMAHLLAGDRPTADRLFAWAQAMRREGGHYLTGLVHPQMDSFPDGELTTYSAAAVILTADALSGASPAAALFVDHAGLPDIIDTESPVHEPD
jgi:hypothetical protein